EWGVPEAETSALEISASMEPPSSLGGMPALRPLSRGRPRALQWSRRVHSAECYWNPLTGAGVDGLQWSRRVHSAECRATAASRHEQRVLQWSRRVHSAECPGCTRSENR